MTNQDNAVNGDEFPDANSGLDAVDLESADTAEAGQSPADAGEAASDAAAEAPSSVGDEPQSEAGFGDAGDSPAENEATTDPVAELTNDLQRVTAEYANYRKRSEERGQIVGEVAVAGVLNELLPILDDLDRAEEHGDYEGIVRSIGDSLRNTVTQLGLAKYGEVGEEFDPSVHEALMAVEAGEGQRAQLVGQVLRPGYKVNDRVIRTAGVAVTQ